MQKTGKDAVEAAASLQNQILDLESRLANIPTHIMKEVCRDTVVDNVCGVFCPNCGSVCKDVVKRVCSMVQEVNALWVQVNEQLTYARRELTNTQSRAVQAAIDGGSPRTSQLRLRNCRKKLRRRHLPRVCI